ncbi:SCO family protein [Wenxinia marina]|uniref:SCO family protein n=1 Tax=Wenxinia marina TaxID=390641 RepID=UPI0004774153|nr:SCO family protein [Wenxinia marina]
MDRRFALAAVLVAVVGLGGTWLAIRLTQPGGDGFAQCRGGAVAGGSLGGPFTLVSETGETVTSEEVIDRPSLLYFGYTYCPDVCPIDAMRNAQAVEMLDAEGIEVKPVFISVDPARDTPEVLAQYTANFHDRMLGLTGSEEQVREAAQAYRVLYSANDDDPEFYTVNHTAFSYIVLPEVGFVDVVRRDEAPEALADRLACFARAAE